MDYIRYMQLTGIQLSKYVHRRTCTVYLCFIRFDLVFYFRRIYNKILTRGSQTDSVIECAGEKLTKEGLKLTMKVFQIY